MDAGGQQIGERLVHQALPRHAVQPGEAGAFHDDGEMALAAAVVAEMAGMMMAVVDHLKLRRGECLGQAIGDDFCKRSGGRIGHRAYIGRFALYGEPVARKPEKDRPNARFHGRVEGSDRLCAEPGCDQPGEFRAPPLEGPGGAEGPPRFRWFCLDHVRAFNARYNFFDGMTADEIHHAQRPLAGWERETRAFARAGADHPPRWADFSDPLDAIGARFRERMANERQRADGKPLSGADRRALKVLGLDQDADRKGLRQRYSELVRKFHPDRNGGDRSMEKALQEVIAAYQHLKSAPAFA